MASAIDIVRALIQDQPVQVQEPLALDGTQTSQRTKFFPIIPSSVTVTGVATPLLIDGQSGVLTWTLAPTAGSYLANYTVVQLLDSTIQIYLDLETTDPGEYDSNVYRLAAASALDAIAASQALILKRIEMLDLKTDGPAVAKALQANAQALRDLVLEGAEDSFEVIQMVNDVYGWREMLTKNMLRGDV